MEPLWVTPPPLMATPCWTLDGLSIVMVTLPDLAESVVLSNLRAPLESAETLRPLEAPAPLEGELPVEVGAAGVVLGVVVVLLLLLDPHPATANATTPAATANVVFIDPSAFESYGFLRERGGARFYAQDYEGPNLISPFITLWPTCAAGGWARRSTLRRW